MLIYNYDDAIESSVWQDCHFFYNGSKCKRKRLSGHARLMQTCKEYTTSGLFQDTHNAVRVKLYKKDASVLPALSGGLRKAALERKYGMGRVSDDPEPLINYLDVSQYY